jgi:hypothetical protein
MADNNNNNNNNKRKTWKKIDRVRYAFEQICGVRPLDPNGNKEEYRELLEAANTYLIKKGVPSVKGTDGTIDAETLCNALRRYSIDHPGELARDLFSNIPREVKLMIIRMLPAILVYNATVDMHTELEGKQEDTNELLSSVRNLTLVSKDMRLLVRRVYRDYKLQEASEAFIVLLTGAFYDFPFSGFTLLERASLKREYETAPHNVLLHARKFFLYEGIKELDTAQPGVDFTKEKQTIWVEVVCSDKIMEYFATNDDSPNANYIKWLIYEARNPARYTSAKKRLAYGRSDFPYVANPSDDVYIERELLNTPWTSIPKSVASLAHRTSNLGLQFASPRNRPRIYTDQDIWDARWKIYTGKSERSINSIESGLAVNLANDIQRFKPADSAMDPGDSLNPENAIFVKLSDLVLLLRDIFNIYYKTDSDRNRLAAVTHPCLGDLDTLYDYTNISDDPKTAERQTIFRAHNLPNDNLSVTYSNNFNESTFSISSAASLLWRSSFTAMKQTELNFVNIRERPAISHESRVRNGWLEPSGYGIHEHHTKDLGRVNTMNGYCERRASQVITLREHIVPLILKGAWSPQAPMNERRKVEVEKLVGLLRDKIEADVDDSYIINETNNNNNNN